MGGSAVGPCTALRPHPGKPIGCGVRVVNVEDALMQKIRSLDNLVDELAKGMAMEKVVRAQRSESPPRGSKPAQPVLRRHRVPPALPAAWPTWRHWWGTWAPLGESTAGRSRSPAHLDDLPPRSRDPPRAYRPPGLLLVDERPRVGRKAWAGDGTEVVAARLDVQRAVRDALRGVLDFSGVKVDVLLAGDERVRGAGLTRPARIAP
jgi:hypothetical protein